MDDIKVRYVRVYFKGSVRAERHGIYLRVTRDTDVAIQGWEVDKNGEEVQPIGFERRLRVVSRKAVLRVVEYEMDRTYAVLKEVKEEQT